MTDLPIWAQDRAREWLLAHGLLDEIESPQGEARHSSLAALLVEVSDSRDRDWQAKMDTEGRTAIEGLKAGVLAEVRRVVEVVLADRWPADVFTPPPKGQHGSTVDACSAAALRAVVPGLRDEILSRLDTL